MEDKNPVGVIVGRFQVPDLHKGHCFLIEEVCRRHSDVLIVIGCSAGLATAENPLDYDVRVAMVKELFPLVTTRPLRDCRSDDDWTRDLDNVIADVFPGRTAILYGSRASFLECYTGRHVKFTLPPIESVTGTEVRRTNGEKPVYTAQFRAGVIYANNHKRPRAYQTVDVAIIRQRDGAVLLGGKKGENGKLRFIGGFVDPTDPSLEIAAKREVREEAGDIEIDDLRYLGSTNIDDWRYRHTSDRIVTAFFAATYIFGCTKAADDIERVVWMPSDKVTEVIVDEHKPLALMLEKYLASK